MKTGPPPTALNARTGLFTPAGITRTARASSAAEPSRDLGASAVTDVTCPLIPSLPVATPSPASGRTPPSRFEAPPSVALAGRPLGRVYGGGQRSGAFRVG